MIEACIKQGYMSTSKLQGYYGIGYSTANRIVLRLEQEGYVSLLHPLLIIEELF
jgi:DNA segregation ATPase FtsK/SpoIIIE-like protein